VPRYPLGPRRGQLNLGWSARPRTLTQHPRSLAIIHQGNGQLERCYTPLGTAVRSDRRKRLLQGAGCVLGLVGLNAEPVHRADVPVCLI